MLTPKKFSVLFRIKEHQLPNKKPVYQVWLDGEQVNDITECGIGPHQIKIFFLNKEPNDTVVDDNCVILHDLAVELQELSIGGTDITHWVKENASYQTTEGNEKTYGFMHKNGVMTLDFACPPFYYLRNLHDISK